MADYKKFRTENNLTQRDVADFLGIPIPFLSQIENNKRPMPTDKLSRLLNNEYSWNTSSLTTDGDPILPPARPSSAQAELKVLQMKNAQLEETVKRLEDQNGKLWQLVEKLTSHNK